MLRSIGVALIVGNKVLVLVRSSSPPIRTRTNLREIFRTSSYYEVTARATLQM